MKIELFGCTCAHYSRSLLFLAALVSCLGCLKPRETTSKPYPPAQDGFNSISGVVRRDCAREGCCDAAAARRLTNSFHEELVNHAVSALLERPLGGVYVEPDFFSLHSATLKTSLAINNLADASILARQKQARTPYLQVSSVSATRSESGKEAVWFQLIRGTARADGALDPTSRTYYCVYLDGTSLVVGASDPGTEALMDLSSLRELADSLRKRSSEADGGGLEQ